MIKSEKKEEKNIKKRKSEKSKKEKVILNNVDEDSGKKEESVEIVEKIRKTLTDKGKTIKLKDFERQLEEIEISRKTNTTLDRIAVAEGTPVILSQARNPVQENSETKVNYLGSGENKYRESSPGPQGPTVSAGISPIVRGDPVYIPNLGKEMPNDFSRNEFDLTSFQRSQRGFQEPMLDYIAKSKQMPETKPTRSVVAKNEFEERAGFLEKYNL